MQDSVPVRSLRKERKTEMRYLKPLAVIALFALAVLTALCIRGQGKKSQTLAWTRVPVRRNGWVAPNKRHWKLADLLAMHKGQQSWKEAIVRDNLLQGDYIQIAPGTKTPRQFHPDNPVWWVMQDGQVRFTIEGQEPFVASKG